MIPRTRYGLLLAILVILVNFSACGSKHNATYPVTGKVTFDNGQPLTTGGMIMFRHTTEDGQAQITASGTFEVDGMYQLSTFKEGDGAVAGRHEVLVRAKRTAQQTGNTNRLSPSPIDPKFERYETSNLTFTVEPGDNEFNIVVKRP
jgi:hypothetical protein